MKQLKQLDMATIRSWGPCYDPSCYLTEDWKGTVLDILKDERIPAADRLWCGLRLSLVSEKVIRLYAVKCARQVEHLMLDERNRNVLSVVERYLSNEATREELITARLAANEARSEAYKKYAAYAAAYAAAYTAAAAYAAAADAAAYAGDYAANAAAYAAAYAAAAAAYAADYAANAAANAADYARTKMRQTQIDILVGLLENGVNTGDVTLEKEAAQ